MFVKWGLRHRATYHIPDTLSPITSPLWLTSKSLMTMRVGCFQGWRCCWIKAGGWADLESTMATDAMKTSWDYCIHGWGRGHLGRFSLEFHEKSHHFQAEQVEL